ncbi:HNH endonuclease [Deinococcus radiophilus]|uniref:HNH endonuclease n=1 Tax=Deinococcus radiophilus TaxID=32062 RepID=A0A3S0I8A7_9DEIO|nr:HNH endonuclease [Deinococcus radiophilus]RTR27487.1 HNH endonuclease [Deinococcus radiophilus]UFA50351.1 HNH endonuclease [Deinococcus radiophilus]
MKMYVGVTDNNWFHMLAQQGWSEEVNFWKPSGKPFKALAPGDLFLFKLHSPHNFIVGGGFFSRAVSLTTSMAWDTFGLGNGATTYEQMRERVFKYRGGRSAEFDPDPVLTCIMLSEPFYFPEELWIASPSSFKGNIVSGKTYRADDADSQMLYESVTQNLRLLNGKSILATPGSATSSVIEAPRYGQPSLIRPRLGQSGFRVMVTEAYQRQCVITGEKTLPVLEAAHIQPYSKGGAHEVSNGLLLRSDLHRLFDLGYLAVEPTQRQVLVSPQIREKFQNGRHYYALQGQTVAAPLSGFDSPAPGNLEYHLREVYLG